MSCKVMGIVNVTPDSFSDGGKYFTPEEALRRIHNLILDGADMIDIGAESTKPGATKLGWQEEWGRLEPVLKLLFSEESGTVPKKMAKNLGPVPISIDTYHPETAERALQLGAGIINCVYEEPISDMLQICAKYGAELILPAKSLGPVPTKVPVYIDPMIGFGTTREEDLELLRSISDLTRKGRVLVGASRKRIVKKLTGEKVTGKNIGGNLGIAAWCAMNGASVVRVHDVKETVQAIKVLEVLSTK